MNDMPQATKRYLLTWYGITDLRAALGFEESGGPVLAAMKPGRFTDVVVLAYTDPGKRSPELADAQRQWMARQTSASQSSLGLAREKELAIVDVFSNTQAAHDLYKAWLRRQIRHLGLSAKVRMCVRELDSLNDSKGIYHTAARALDSVSSEPGERDVTCYVSPGTPLMAFTWAFLALTNPDMSIKVIACPDYRKAPEEIQIPYELLAPSNRRARQACVDTAGDFDVVFHLFGEQRMPSIFGVRQFPCSHHVFITSEKYPSEIMRQFIPAGAKCDELLVNPFDPMSAKLAVLKAVADLPSARRVGFNLTGGTKLMFAGTIAACRKIGGIPFYFETRNHNLLFLHDYTTLPLRGIESVDTFFHANGFAVMKPGKWDDNEIRKKRVDLTNRLWKERWTIAKAYKQLASYADFDEDAAFRPFSFCVDAYNRGQRVPVEISLDESGRGTLSLGGTTFSYRNCPDFAKYLSGGWMEEYCYLLLEPLLRNGSILDLRVGLEVSWEKPQDGVGRFQAQEFDIVLTDGRRLYIIECKAGAVLSEHVYKLQNCVRNYGGVDARGILVSAFRPHHPVTRKRIETAANLSSLHGWDVTNKLASIVVESGG